MAFGAGVAFMAGIGLIALKFVWAIIGKTYEKRIAALEGENHRCEDRVKNLELLLFLHGPSQIRSELQGVVSEIHVDAREAIDAAKKRESGQ